jgi:hypothetical protein
LKVILRCRNYHSQMVAQGQKQKSDRDLVMSALPSKADIRMRRTIGRNVPITTILHRRKTASLFVLGSP